MPSFRDHLLIYAAILIAAISGCSGNPTPPSGVIVTGKVVKAVQPLTAERLPPGEFVAELIFVPMDATGERDQERINPDGTFRETGRGNGIKPGKYRVAVTHFVTGRGSDGLKGAFSEQKSPITVDIPAD